MRDIESNRSSPSYIILLILFLICSCSEKNDKIEIFLIDSSNLSMLEEVEPKDVVLKSKIITEKDIIGYDKSTFTFDLTKECSSKLDKMELDWKAFCVVKNGQKLLVGRFWKCSSSVGTNGFVTFDFTCSNRQKLELIYGLAPKVYPNDNDPRKVITIANNGYK